VTDAAVAARRGVQLPDSGDIDAWTDDQRALLDFAGLVVRKPGQEARFAPRPTVVAFLQQCERTGLDPIARQIYAIERGGKWGVQVSIDGMRLVAQRSGVYAGQGPIEWTGDGRTWVDVWLSEEPPAAARATVHRRGFDVPMVAVARWSSYVVQTDEWVDGRKTGRRKTSAMWARMPDLMLGKVAEALALRRAFPMELSGLYSEDETEFAALDDGDAPRGAPVPAGESLGSGTRSAQRAVTVSETTDGSEVALGDHGDVSGAPRGPVGPESGTSSVGVDDPLRLTAEERAEYGLDGDDVDGADPESDGTEAGHATDS